MKDCVSAGREIYEFAGKIYPINRSITGEGVRKTLRLINDELKNSGAPELNICEVPSGTAVFDWTVPKEWSIEEGYIEDEEGKRIVDFKENFLHILGYSVPVDEWVDLEELKTHIYVQEDMPDAIPYVTSYYKERYGFCMSMNQRDSLKPGKYHMVIKSSLFDGSLTYGELILPGKSEKEVLISTYICHPNMANNEVSGPALSTFLIKYLAGTENRKYTYRFVFIPETIGSITYLSRNLSVMKEHTVAGFNLSCVGDDRDYSILESRYADSYSDRILSNVLKFNGKYTRYDFSKRGSDERQYNAPGVDLGVVVFSRTLFTRYPEYHTSLDDMNLISPEGFAGSYRVMTQVIDILENNEKFRVKVLCEPQLGKRGLYPTISKKGSYDAIFTQRDLIAYSDGRNDLIDISERIGVPVSELIPIKNKLVENDLLEIYEEQG